jgi:hypothetical protein
MADAVQFLYGVGDSIAIAFRRVIGFLLVIAFIALFIYIIIFFVIKIKRHRNITAEQNRLLRKGRIYAKKFKLRNLYTSVEGKKIVNVGNIVSLVKVKDLADKKEYYIFGTKKGMLEYRFWKVPIGHHTKIFGDITLTDWNFKLDLENRFMVLNDIVTESEKIYKPAKEVIGVDTIGGLSPVVAKAVQTNPRHRIRLRESKLIKIPDENISTISEGVSQYLEG